MKALDGEFDVVRPEATVAVSGRWWSTEEQVSKPSSVPRAQQRQRAPAFIETRRADQWPPRRTSCSSPLLSRSLVSLFSCFCTIATHIYSRGLLLTSSCFCSTSIKSFPLSPAIPVLLKQGNWWKDSIYQTYHPSRNPFSKYRKQLVGYILPRQRVDIWEEGTNRKG